MNPATTLVTRTLERSALPVRCFRTLRIAVDGRATATIVDKPLFRIGSHSSNDLVLADATVSKHHLEIRCEANGYRVIDLSTSNGTFLGELRLGEVTIAQAATLRLGRSTLHLEPAGDEVEVAASEK